MSASDTWVNDAIVMRDLGRIPVDVAGAHRKLIDAQSNADGGRLVQDVSPSLAIAACHDAARKAVTAHMAARGLRPRKGEGAHRIVLEYARSVLAESIDASDLRALDDLRRDRADAEYGETSGPMSGAQLRAAADVADCIINAVRSLLPPESPQPP